MGRKLGYADYIPLGYDRMQRNCYAKEDVERFRARRARVHRADCGAGLRARRRPAGEDAAHGLRRLRHVVYGRQREARRHAGGDNGERPPLLPRAERRDGGVHRLHVRARALRRALPPREGRRRLLHDAHRLEDALHLRELQRHERRRGGHNPRGRPRLRELHRARISSPRRAPRPRSRPARCTR